MTIATYYKCHFGVLLKGGEEVEEMMYKLAPGCGFDLYHTSLLIKIEGVLFMLCTPLVQWNESNSKWCWCCHHLTNIKMMYYTSITEMTHRMVICITSSLPLRVESTNLLANITDTSTIRNLIWLDVGWKRSSPFME